MIKYTQKEETNVFIAEDGRRFNEEQDCLNYERSCELRKIIQDYTERGIDKCMYHINPMADKIAAFVNLYDTYDHWQGEWYCYSPVTEEDIDFINKWLELKGLFDYEKFYEGYCICNKIEKFEINGFYIVVVLKDIIYIITPEEIKEKIRDIFERSLNSLDHEIDNADRMYFSHKRNKLKIAKQKAEANE